MEQCSFVGPAFSQTPLGQYRQSILVDAALAALYANAGFREQYHQMIVGLHHTDNRYLRIDVTDARKGLLTAAIFSLDARTDRDWNKDFAWLDWVKAVGIPPTDANFQHNVRLQAQPVVSGWDIGHSPVRDTRKDEWIKFGLNPVNRYGYLGRYEDLDIVLAASNTPLELVRFLQFRL